MTQRVFSSSLPGGSREHPPWLQQVLDDQGPAPRIFAWSLSNLPAETGHASKANREQQWADPRQRVYILGLGNLGRLFATCLAKLPNRPPITLVVHRRELLEHWLSSPGIEMTRQGVTERTEDFEIEWWTDEKPIVGDIKEVGHNKPISNLIVATKAPAAIPQVDRLRGYLDSKSTVVFIQNGMSRLWPPYGAFYNSHRYPAGTHPNWMLGVTMHGVYSEGTFRSVFASPADVILGPVSLSDKDGEASDYLTKQITSASELAGKIVSRPQVWILQLEKLVINMVINPLTAILRVKNGKLFEQPGSGIENVMDLILEETSKVYQALVRHDSTQEVSQNTTPTKEHGEQLSRQALLERFSAPRFKVMLHQVGEKVKENRSSMFQDVVAGKPTEIREFNGWLVETANFLDPNLDVTSHKTLIELVEAGVVLEASELGRYFPGINK